MLAPIVMDPYAFLDQQPGFTDTDLTADDLKGLDR